MDVLTTEHKNLGSNPTINDRAVTIIIHGATPTTQYTQTAGCCIIIILY